MKGNKTILGSILAISLVSIILASSYTGAFFKDVETSEDNSFSSGLLDMKIANNDGNYTNGIIGTWTAEDFKPGDEYEFISSFVSLVKTPESIEANHTEITCDYSVEDTCDPLDPDYLESDTDCHTDDNPDEMAKEMIITKCVYTDGSSWCIDCLTGEKFDGYAPINHNCTGNVIDSSNDWKIEDQLPLDGKISFYDLKNDDLDNFPPILESPEYKFQMSVKFDETAGNDFQGDTFNLTMIFTLNQDASQ